MKLKGILAILLIVVLLVSIAVVMGVSAAAASLPAAGADNEIDVWLISGQSNAIGSAYVSNYPTDEAYSEYKDMLTAGSSNVWYIGNDKTEFSPSGFGFGSDSRYSGPEIGFTTALDGNGRMNAIIKQAHGNTSLHNNTTSEASINYGTWTPPSYIEKHGVETLGNRTGDLYLTFMQKVEDSIKLLEESGYKPIIRGVYYMQGEADTFGAASSGAYKELLETLIYDMRADLTEIAGYDLSELPFVYGRVHRNPGIDPSTGNPYTDKTPYLTTVQAAQDEVASLGIKNVYMIDFRTDLRDPVSGEQRDPVQQDGWHYDSLTQQMIGEEAIRLIENTDGEQTEYGFIPSAYANAASYPLAVFKKVNGSYTFDSAKTTPKLAFARARELMPASGGAVSDVAILLRADCTKSDYPENVSDIAGAVTLDLGGKTLTAKTSLGNIGVSDAIDSNGKQKKTVINIKNGKLLMRDFGVIFNAVGSNYAENTGEKVFDYNFENVYLGFSSDAASASSGKGMHLLVSDRSTSTVKNVKFNLNLNDCTLDFVTNAKSGAMIGQLYTSNMTDCSMADYDIKFYGCTFMVNSLSNLNATVSESGDSVKFMKGSDGSFGKIISASDLGSSSSITGSDGGVDTSLKLKSLGQEDGKNNYSLVAAGEIQTAYGTISADYSDSEKYPLVVFHKASGESSYSLVGGYSDWVAAISAAANKIKGVNGATKDDSAVILVRRDYEFSNLYSSTSVIGGTLTIDLGGYTVTCRMSLMNTTSADFGKGVGGSTYVNIKNGKLISATKYGLIYNRTGAASSYTVPKTYYFNFDNVYFGYTYSADMSTKLLIQAEGTNMTDANSIATDHVYNYNNCVIDMSGAPAGSVVAKLNANDSIEKLNYEVYFKNSRFITDAVGKIAFTKNANGDNVTFLTGTDGKYPEILIEKKYAEPDASYKFSGGGNYVLSYSETGRVEGKYKVYELLTGIDTKYGYIDLADVNRGFVVFAKNSDGKYTMLGSHTTWKSAVTSIASSMNAAAPTLGECVIYVTRDVTDSGYPENASDLAGIINVDLGGNKFVNRNTLFRTDVDDCVASGETVQKKLTVNIFNGELVFYNFGLVFATSTGTYTTEKTFEFNIENVKFGYDVGASAITEANKGVDLLVSDRSAPASTNVYYNFNVKNCTFDMVTNARMDARLGNLNTTNSAKDSARSVYTIKFTNCTFITDNVNKVAFAKSTSGDSVVMKAGSNGKYSAVLIPGSKPEFYTAIFDAEGSKSLYLVYAGATDGWCKYDMTEVVGSITETTSYGTISNEYVDSSKYPFALFYKDTNGKYQFSKCYATYTTAMTAAIELTKASNASRTSEAVVFLRCDWAAGGYPTGTSDVATKITVDLNGYSLGALESLTNTGTQDSLDPNGNKIATNGVIEYKNGSLLMRSHGLIYLASKGTYTAGYEKTITFNFENVYIGFYPGAGGVSLIGRVASNHTSTTNTVNVNFKNCTFDMVTNRSTHASLVFGNWTAGTDCTKVNTVYENCEFIGNTESDMIAKTSSNDTVLIKKSGSGNYASLTLPASAAAPAATYVNANGITLSFVKVSQINDTVTYRLRAADVESVDFAPKMSLTLDRNLILNVYIPAKDILNSFTIDNVKYESFDGLETAILGKQLYYRIEVVLDARSAARDVVLRASVDVGDKTATATFNLGIVKYAEKILADGSDMEKTLVRDVLSYVRAAYVYFGTDDDNAMSKINTILGAGYDTSNAIKVEGSATAEAAGLKSATFSLDGTPSMRFYLADGADASKYEFFIDGTRVKTETSADGKYIDIDVYAYALCETVTYTIDGVESGSFHIRAYYEWSKTQNNENLVNLTARFWKYLQSARDYRDSVVED